MVGALFVNPQVIFPEPKICKCAGSCARACVLSHYKALALAPEWALPEDERTRLRCIGTSDSSFLRAADPDHLACVSSRDAVDAVNAILRLRGPRWRGGVWSRSRLSRKDVEALKALTTVCNLVPNPVDRSGVASYRRLSPDDAAAVLGHELDDDGRSPTAWLRDLDCPPSGVSDVWATEMKLLRGSRTRARDVPAELRTRDPGRADASDGPDGRRPLVARAPVDVARRARRPRGARPAP